VLYMLIEHCKHQDAMPVYRRFHERGRLAPEGLHYVSRWVDEKPERCFQLMETPDSTRYWMNILHFSLRRMIFTAAQRKEDRL
jgi:hypothetical protein